MPLKCITVIIILLSSVAVFFMDIVGSLFFNQKICCITSFNNIKLIFAVFNAVLFSFCHKT